MANQDRKLDRRKQKTKKELVLLKQRFQSLTEQLKIKSNDSYFPKFYIVRACGYLESVVRESFLLYVLNRSSGQIANFVTGLYPKGQNPKPEKLIKLLGHLGEKSLNEGFQNLIEENDEELKREILFLVKTRNSIAHGGNESAGYVKALRLSTCVEKIADWFIKEVGNR